MRNVKNIELFFFCLWLYNDAFVLATTNNAPSWNYLLTKFLNNVNKDFLSKLYVEPAHGGVKM